jgi:hypothetical protein
MKAAASEIPASLARIADSLNCIAGTPIEGEVQLLRPELDVLRTRMRQLETLLDGAAAFYCASIARSRDTGTQPYTAQGIHIAAAVVHQLQVNA